MFQDPRRLKKYDDFDSVDTSTLTHMVRQARRSSPKARILALAALCFLGILFYTGLGTSESAGPSGSDAIDRRSLRLHTTHLDSVASDAASQTAGIQRSRANVSPSSQQEPSSKQATQRKENPPRAQSYQEAGGLGPQSPLSQPQHSTPNGEYKKFMTFIAGTSDELEDHAQTLPDMVEIPLERAVEGFVLEGWEDDWIALGEYTGPKLAEPKIDFVYTWVNGSDPNFQETMHPYQIKSRLNDESGKWLRDAGRNRFRDWDELRFAIRSAELHSDSFRNKIQLLVTHTGVDADGNKVKQRPTWLRPDKEIEGLEVVGHYEFFEQGVCAPTFNSLSIEGQIFNTPSNVDRLFIQSDDMFLGRTMAASDLYSPLFGTIMSFMKNIDLDVRKAPGADQAKMFGESPYLIYTAYMFGRRFGNRKRSVPLHFGKSVSRSISREAFESFPRPALNGACQRFRGELGFQMHPWFTAYYYTIERHREALLWSYIMVRSDLDGDGYLNWNERQKVLFELRESMQMAKKYGERHSLAKQLNTTLLAAGLEPPRIQDTIKWTSMDGPIFSSVADCHMDFDVNECLAPGFSVPDQDNEHISPAFSTASIFATAAKVKAQCGDCLIKHLLNRSRKGLGPLMPEAGHPMRATVVKALVKYSYTVTEPNGFFFQMMSSEQIQSEVLNRFVTGPDRFTGHICVNDDVNQPDPKKMENIRKNFRKFMKGFAPEPSSYERLGDMDEDEDRSEAN